MDHDWQQLIEELRGAEYRLGVIQPGSPFHRVNFDAGLSDDEILSTESRFGFRFPPDLRAFLQTAIPCGPRFPDWRSGDETVLRDWLDRPRQGILFDIEHNGFWFPEWGPRPRLLDSALGTGSELVAAAPQLIPISSQRMMPEEPHLPGNPVFSVHQTDVIYYGFDLADYIRHEFDLPGREPWPEQIRPIRFWDIARFQDVRWEGGSCRFDNRKGPLPT